MRQCFREFLLVKKKLSDPIVTLPGIWILRKIILPKRLLIAINLRARPRVGTHQGEQNENNACRGNLDLASTGRPEMRHSDAKQCNQGNVGEVLEMICH